MQKSLRQPHGFSTLELLIALTLFIMVMTAVILLNFGSQSVMADSQTNSEALGKAQALLEEQQALARKDFRLVNPTGPITDTIYTKKVDVLTLPDHFTKEITATVSWDGGHGRDLSVSLKALVTNFTNATSADTCHTEVSNSGNWKLPQKQGNRDYDFASELISGSGSYPITDIDAFGGNMYVTVDNTTGPTDHTLFVFDISNPNVRPVLRGSVDNSATTRAGLAAVVVAKSSVDPTKTYAFTASAVQANFSSCVPNTEACAQLQIFDVSSGTPVHVSNLKLPGVIGTGGQGVGNSITYHNGYLYIGLTKTASGSEFFILDVHDPLNPIVLGHKPIGHAVNAIAVKNGYAYVAHPTEMSSVPSEQLTVFQVSVPSNPVRTSGYLAADTLGNGKSLALVGDKLYLGRTLPASGKELAVLNNTTASVDPMPLLGDKEINESVNQLIVRDYLAFLMTTTGRLQIWNIAEPTNITRYDTSALTIASGSSNTPMDCEGNTLYIGTTDGSQRGKLTVVTSAP